MMITLTELLTAYEVDRSLDREQRNHPGLTASALGGCLRRHAFDKANTPISNERPTTSVATVGSLLHEAIALLWQQEGATTEATGEHGTADVVDGDTVRDTKTVSRGKFDAWRRNAGPPEHVWKQAHAYGVDHNAKVVVIDVLCRETGRAATYVMDFDPLLAEDALAELAAGDAAIADGIPPIPDDRYGHGDPICDNCPFLDHCWGEAEEHPVFDGSDIEAMALEYLEATAQEKAAKETKARLRKRLAGASGPYGSIKIRWKEMPGKHVEYDAAPYRTLNVSRVD